MIVKIDRLSHDFKGIGKINDKVLFVDRVLPKEIVDVRIVKEKKNYCNGKLYGVIDKSPDRIDSICPYFDICGGCTTGYIRYNKALEYKKNIFIDIMKRYANLDVNPEIISNYVQYGYRNKISLKVMNGKISLSAEDSNDLVNIDKCYLVNDNISRVMERLNDINLNGLRDIIIRGTDDIMIVLNGNIDGDIIVNSFKDMVSSIILNDEVIYGKEYIVINVDKYKYAVYPKSFFQVNTNMISKLYNKVSEYAGNDKSLLDLYCGTGTIGIYLAKNFDRVRGVEVNSDAIVSANLNKIINNIDNISFECKKANEINNINEDVVVVDPPRGGLDKITIDILLDSDIKRLVYVSCNPITLARDINILKDKYDVKDMTLFDNFPSTKHMESVVLLQKKKL